MRLTTVILFFAFCPSTAVSQSTAPPVPSAIAIEPHPSSDSRASHLLEAAHHLEIAGLVDQAREIRDLAEKEEHFHEELHEKIASRDALTKEIQRLRQLTGEHEQVAVYATMCELSLSKLRRANITIDGIDTELLKTGGFGAVLASRRSNEQTNVQEERVIESRHQSVRFQILENEILLSKLTTALKAAGVLTTLAEPALVTTSGRRASFFSGGEFALVVPGPDGNSSIEHRQFGTHLECLPVVLGNGKIRLEVKPRISQIDAERSVVVGGVTVPGLRVRHVDTGVEMNLGQTLVLAGLVQNTRKMFPAPHAAIVDPKNPQSVTESQKAGQALEEAAFEEVELVVMIRTELFKAPRAARRAGVE